ncbi:MAG: glycosyltransferase, partial [bacterium]|nr:glycosyltransferase [bacterium]
MIRPKISVILSVYEQPSTLDLALAALAAQEFRHEFEVIVCDDGSSPAMLQVCRRAAERLNLDVRFIWQPDRGYRLARSRNNAIRCAQGDLLLFLDGDIVVKPDFLRRHSAGHEKPREIVCGPRKWVHVELGAPTEAETRQPGATGTRDQSGNFARMLSRIEKASRDLGRQAQLRWLQSNHPWLACSGFGFSIERSEFAHFDEN